MSAESKRSNADWERVESEYRAGLLSVREIAAAHGVSHTAIQKRAKVEGWERDLNAKIKAKADALVAKREVATEVATERLATDRLIIEANAEVIAGVRLAHRKDIARSRKLAMALLEELESQTERSDLIDKLDDLVSDDDSDAGVSDKLRQLYMAVTSLPGRTKTMKDLADTLQKLVTLEREAYGIADAKKIEISDTTPKGLADFYAGFASGTSADAEPGA